MKKIGSYIRNVYLVYLKRPGKNTKIMKIVHDNSKDPVDLYLRDTLVNDFACPLPDENIRLELEQRVRKRTGNSMVTENSLTGFLFPLFSFRYIEMKMAILSILFVVSLGFGPVVNHTVNRNINPVFLADTLIDSSNLYIPALSVPTETEF